ncbi:Hypothetical predicted protein [Paramuricea clavata]|uniref:Uncharacterized protein n=1 Tax=Paramuricea clavata TaxID=317549 RepID=A0A7D9E8W4_PARCT|nr:Hypothetical predicted protein [Paramuricea clavata]
MASYSDMNEFSIEQLMALNSIIYSDNEIDERVENIMEDKTYRIAPSDKGKDPLEGERQFVDEVDRDMEKRNYGNMEVL